APPAAALQRKLRPFAKRRPRFLPTPELLRLLRGVAGTQKGLAVQAAAVAALRAGCEAHLLALLQDWGQCALHARRAAVRSADVRLVRCLRGERS
ncbi:H3 protein, partial [Nothocercus nigrocapillus]|nr:H3 protein [Nothocercus nigrocapillus]